jgi:D-2-hydroxyacid dehydrogenase (NADP+)
MVILSDWNHVIEAYKIPLDLISEINKFYGSSVVKFIGDKFNNEDVKYYFGNLPKQQDLETYPNLEWIHFGSVGIDKLEDSFIKEKLLTVTNGAQTNTKSVITYCMGEIFRSCKAGFLIRRDNDDLELTREYFNQFYEYMTDYNDISICLLGYGDIGKGLAKLLSPIVKEIKVVTQTKRSDFKNVSFFTLSEIKKALKDTSHLVNVLPLHKETNNIVNLDTLSNSDGIYYICAGRAETHSLDDIIYALKNGIMRGASIDVHGLKGGIIQDSILKLNNVHLTPHISGWTNKFWNYQSKIVLTNIAKAKTGKYEDMTNLIYLKGIKRT